MTSDKIIELVNEFKSEKNISDFEDKNKYQKMFETAIYSINQDIGYDIDYKMDLQAKELLFNYVFYALYNRLVEFKELYAQDYIKLQAKYYSSNV